MLTSTFIHAPGVGPTTERSLWEQGATTWTDYLRVASSLAIAERHREALLETVVESIEALGQGDAHYFARKLPSREHWRAADHFSKIGYLDIETDGGMDPDSITLIGLYDGFEPHFYTKGDSLAQFAYECQDYDGFVTFFGGGFDVPLLKRRFPILSGVFQDRLHIDLCPLLKTLGYRGGLKSIERQLGINRRPETEGLGGLDAVRLWRIHQQGGPAAGEAMRLLKLYNEEDVVNLKTLLEFAIPRLRLKAGIPDPSPPTKED